MSRDLFAEVLWLVMPVLLGGLVHVLVIKRRLWPALARVPLDGGRTWRGRRWLGENKTLRGVVVMVIATTIFALIEGELWRRFEWARSISPVNYAEVPPLRWGLLLGFGYVLGELPNSFLKRQLDIPPGGSTRGGRGVIFWLADQLDSLIGVLVAIAMVWVPPWPVVVTMVAVTLIVHPAVALLMYVLGLKTRIG